MAAAPCGVSGHAEKRPDSQDISKRSAGRGWLREDAVVICHKRRVRKLKVQIEFYVQCSMTKSKACLYERSKPVEHPHQAQIREYLNPGLRSGLLLLGTASHHGQPGLRDKGE